MDVMDRLLVSIGKIAFSLILPTSLLAVAYGIERGFRKQRMTLGTGQRRRIITGPAARRRGLGFIALGTWGLAIWIAVVWKVFRAG